MWDKIKEVFNSKKRFVLTTHMNPDHDGIGSEVALAAMLKTAGKDVRIINVSPTPDDCSFLAQDAGVEVFSLENSADVLKKTDVIVMLDMSVWGRLDMMADPVKESKALKLCIDHHVSPSPIGDINVVDPSFSCTGELLLDMARFCGFEVTAQIAQALYSCMLMDTGRFIYENTSSRTLENCAFLYSTGMDREFVHEKLFYSYAPSRYKLLGCAMQNLTLLPECCSAYFYLTQENLETVPPEQRDTEDFADHLRALRGVDLGVFLRPAGDAGQIRLSIRSSGDASARGLALALGGGGHRHAAGAIVDGTMDEVLEMVVNKLHAFCCQKDAK